jgi:polar amino acid transport system permease protein
MSLFVHYISLPYLLEGIWFTVVVTALGLGGGLILGLVLAAMQLSRFSVLAAFARGYTVVFRGTPLILQMVFAYDALPQIGLKLSAIGAAGLALAANEAPFIAEMLRAGGTRHRPWTNPGRPGARDDAGIADATHHRASGHSHDDSCLR